MTTEEMIAENARRNAALMRPYDPESGLGCCGPRRETIFLGRRAWLPADMPPTDGLSEQDALDLRFRHDFEFWAICCATIHYKQGPDGPFRLNAGQRKVLEALESQRRTGRPLRVIVLKARQWGCSTFIQIYMAWLQIILWRGRNSFICAHVKDASLSIRTTYDKLLGCYPRDYWREEAEPCFRPFRGAQNIREIAGRDCRVAIGSAENQDSSRGTDISIAHLSEVAFWKETRQRSPEELVQAAVSGIVPHPETFIAMESTANGVGSYFHREWLRSVKGESDKRAVFVAWYEIEAYRLDVPCPAEFIAEMDDYERELWNRGVTLEAIAWYHVKKRESQMEFRIRAEFPSTDAEAFANTGCGVFATADVEALRDDCRKPLREEGDLKVWAEPDAEGEYIAAVDVGGRSSGSDWSVIAVTRTDTPVPVVVAQWRGHEDHDCLAERAARLAWRYAGALLVIESNTLESECGPGEPSVILDQLGRRYRNLYMRRTADETGVGGEFRPGFHTNRKTKAAAMARLIEIVREKRYVERDTAACDEYLTYEQLPNGAWAARRGCHDDILMTRLMTFAVMAQTRTDLFRSGRSDDFDLPEIKMPAPPYY